MKIDKKLDEILEDFDTWCLCKNNECIQSENYIQAKEAIKQLFQELIDEVISEDKPLPIDDRDWDRVTHENQLKAEQRQRAKELLEKM